LEELGNDHLEIGEMTMKKLKEKGVGKKESEKEKKKKNAVHPEQEEVNHQDRVEEQGLFLDIWYRYQR
jgi:hypothetical protein